MASLTVRNLEPALKEQLRIRAARHGRSMEEEARHILRDAIEEPDAQEHLVDVFAELFGTEYGVELQVPSRELGRGPSYFARYRLSCVCCTRISKVNSFSGALDR
jgi:antitoxin FitA